MNRVVLISVGLAGCFYTDPINQRPSVAIHWDPMELARGDAVTLEGVADDPDGDVVAYQWRAYACNQNGDTQTCDEMQSDSGVDHEFVTHVPTVFQDPANIASKLEVNVFQITLEGRDSYGATARPSQTLDIPVGDAAPTLKLEKATLRAYVVNNDIPVSAKVGDVDDGPASVTLSAWNAIGPAGAGNFTLPAPVIIPDDPSSPDPAHIQFGTTFHPTITGDWMIDVVATDPQGLTNDQMLPVHVDDDHVPCLAQWDPTATTAPNTTIPITDPTLFQVLVVLDDLDPYPPSGGNSTTFHWSIVPPGGMRQQLTTVTGSGVALDPDSYTPGDIVELRVEIEDRKHVAVNCPDTDLTCSVISDQSCLQRLTWRVEVR